MVALPEPSLALSGGFVALALAVLAAALAAVNRAAGQQVGLAALGFLAVWTLGWSWLAREGHLAHFEPPHIMALLALELLALVWLWRSPLGSKLAGLPLWGLVGFQGFRVLVELLIHRAVVEGIAPPQMTWSGWNLDILTGVSALALAPLVAAGRVGPAAVRWWNRAGAAILGVVLAVAVLSMPTPLRVFEAEPPNVWVTGHPFVLLPSVLVFAALAVHVLVARKLSMSERPPSQ